MSISSGSGRQRQTFNEINITPLTDVFLVLLVVMFILAPLLDNQAALKVDPPSAQSAQNTDASKLKSVLIEVNKEGEIAVNGEVIVQSGVPIEEVSDKVYKALENQKKSMAAEGANPQEKPIVKLKADSKSYWDRVTAVVDAVNRAQVGKLSLITTVPAGKAAGV